MHQTTVYLSLSMATISAAPAHSLPEYSAETGGCSLACREMSCPRVDPAPRGILFASFAPWPGVCWLPFLPCTWGCFRLLFHEILGQKNLPILIWQAWDHYHFRAGRELRDSIKLLLEIRILRCKEVKQRSPINQVSYGKARTWIQAPIPLSQFKGLKHWMNQCRRF